MTEYWDIEEGSVDSTSFFRLVHKYFSDATTIYFEGTSIEKDIIECYQKHSEEGEFLPRRQTIWPRSKCFRCKISEQFIEEICQLSQNHAEPELMDHLSIYKGDQALLEWHDAFSNAMLLSKSLPEKTVASFSKELGLNYGEAKFS